MFGTRLPVMQAPIGSAATVELAAAVADGGGLGSLAGSWTPPDVLRARIRDLGRRTSAPFAVNLVLAFAQEARVAVCREERVPVVTFSWGVRKDMVEELQATATRVLVQVGSVEEARLAAETGADGLIVQGMEAGGHVQGTAALLELVGAVAGAVDLPLGAAGGLADARAARHVISAGASGVVMGTRYLATKEADAHPVWQEAILASEAQDTVLCTLFDIGWPDAPHRVIRNSTMRRWEAEGSPVSGCRPGEREAIATTDGRAMVRYSDVPPVRRTQGDVEGLALYAGEGVGAIDRIEAAGEVTARIGGAIT